MRDVRQLPASMTSVVEAPRAVSSDASPTRPLCAVKRASMPAAAPRGPRGPGRPASPAVPGKGRPAARDPRPPRPRSLARGVPAGGPDRCGPQGDAPVTGGPGKTEEALQEPLVGQLHAPHAQASGCLPGPERAFWPAISEVSNVTFHAAAGRPTISTDTRTSDRGPGRW